MRRNLYNDHMLTGSHLREAREERGWTQARLAEALGLEPEKGGKLVSSWEHAEEVPRLREADLRRLLFPEGTGDDIARYSTARLAAEISAMLAELVRRVDDSPRGSEGHGVVSDRGYDVNSNSGQGINSGPAQTNPAAGPRL